jgi:hypothetical protein
VARFLGRHNARGDGSAPRPAGPRRDTVRRVRIREPQQTWPVAAGSLVVGFAVAQATGVRPLGGIVLLAGAGWCARRWLPAVGTRRTLTLLGVYLAAFVLSHVIAGPVGTWPAVAIVAAIAGGAAWLGADASRSPAGPVPRTL